MKDLNSKLILGIAGIGLVALIVGFLAFFQAFKSSRSVLSQPGSDTQENQLTVNTPETTAKLKLTPATTTVKVGEEFAVEVVVQANNEKIHGIDAVLNYDPAALKPVRVEELSDLFIFPRKMLTENNVIITALTNLDGNLTIGEEKLVRIVFQALTSGQTSLNFEFQKGATVGSTVIEASKSANILNSVSPAIIAVTN